MSEGKVLSPLEKQLQEEAMSLGDIVTTVNNKMNEWHRQRAWKDKYIDVRLVLKVIQSQQPPETKELLAHWKKRRRHDRSGHYCDLCDDEVWLVDFGVKLEAFLNRVALKEAELQQLTQDLRENKEKVEQGKLKWKYNQVVNLLDGILKRLEALQGDSKK